MKHATQKIIYLMGPTASGKTQLAIELVQQLPLEIISVDSAMIYRDMNIGTAKPTSDILEVAPHHLIDIIDPAIAYSAGAFREDALKQIEIVHAHGKIPLLVGGTMLYYRVLQAGLAELPTANPNLRADIKNKAELLGWPALHAELLKIDADAAHKIHENDSQRIQRALEVFYTTGQPISYYQKHTTHPQADFDLLQIALYPNDRSHLHHKIQIRFEAMLKAGFVDEVKILFSRGDLHADLPSMRSVGYREIWSYLSNEMSFDEMKEKAVASTRQLAKRQMTWLRTWENVLSFDSDSATLSQDVFREIKQFIER